MELLVLLLSAPLDILRYKTNKLLDRTLYWTNRELQILLLLNPFKTLPKKRIKLLVPLLLLICSIPRKITPRLRIY